MRSASSRLREIRAARIACVVATTFVLLALSATARADELSVRTIEFGSWPSAVGALEANVQSQGRAIHVFVRDESGRPVGCGSYTLVLDAIATRAFAVEACDPVTSATALRLVDRHVLFAHDDFVPRPLPAGISAVQVRRAGSTGGAGHVGGSEVQCSLALRPYLTDLETGERVYLPPGRFAMHVLSQDVRSTPGSRGWTLQSYAAGEVDVEYEIVDTARGGERVLQEHVSLRCGVRPPDSRSEDPNARADPFERLDLGSVERPAAVQGGHACSDAPLLPVRRYRMSSFDGSEAVTEIDRWRASPAARTGPPSHPCSA